MSYYVLAHRPQNRSDLLSVVMLRAAAAIVALLLQLEMQSSLVKHLSGSRPRRYTRSASITVGRLSDNDGVCHRY